MCSTGLYIDDPRQRLSKTVSLGRAMTRIASVFR